MFDCFKEQVRSPVELLFSRAWCAVFIAEGAIEEPICAELASGFEITNRSVDIVVTVQDERLRELEGDGGLACTGWADEKEGLRKTWEEVRGGFHSSARVSWVFSSARLERALEGSVVNRVWISRVSRRMSV